MNYTTSYEPVGLLNEVNKILEQAIIPRHKIDSSHVTSKPWIPHVDIKEEKNQFVILADLPGVDKKDVNISMENTMLSITGTRNEDAEEVKSTYYRIERVRGNFQRQFTLPETADSSNIEAKMSNGILKIYIPKKESLSRLIEIKDGEE